MTRRDEDKKNIYIIKRKVSSRNIIKLTNNDRIGDWDGID